MRINKYLSHHNISSRREADIMVAEGKILVNGKKAELGMQVEEGDVVEVVGKSKQFIYYLYHKPQGIVTHSPQEGEISIDMISGLSKDIYPIGRLDKDSRGLMILTNDGRIVKRLLDPSSHLEKEYIVTLNKPINTVDIRKLREGVVLDGGYKTRACKIKRLAPELISITLTEGKKRQIRRMAQSLRYKVVDLVRIRFGTLELGDLAENQTKKIKPSAMKKLLGENYTL